MEKVLQAQGITKVYGKKEALKGVDISFRSNCIYGLIGRNGAGKTTLLGCLTGQTKPTSGQVTYGGQPVWENEQALGEICFSRELSQMLFLGQNTYKVKDYLRAAKIYYPHWNEFYAQTIVDQFGLDCKKKIRSLSKGMLSMVTIVIAMASNAPITILDEPVAGLDIVAREQFYKILLEDYQKTGRTFIVSTHILDEASPIFEEVVLLNDGKILESGNTEELMAQFHYVMGTQQEIESVLRELKVKAISQEMLGKSKSVVVRCSAEQLLPLQEKYDIIISGMNLQKVFVALTDDRNGR